ncbi:hypothetical protein [Amycolatopsis acidicola]|uniref:hypothetical protein n=1 Tax=Amycolatopsis acidicola TaxID=2596893 RepID=UPI001FB5D4A6|nr:hypothetical protein [Amycolatopsis acidicola]
MRDPLGKLAAPDGRALKSETTDPDWPNTWPKTWPTGSAKLWLEREGPATAVDAMILERAGAAARGVLERTRGAEPTSVVFDAAAPESARLRAARQLGFGERDQARAIALSGGIARVARVSEPDRKAARASARRWACWSCRIPWPRSGLRCASRRREWRGIRGRG